MIKPNKNVTLKTRATAHLRRGTHPFIVRSNGEMVLNGGKLTDETRGKPCPSGTSAINLTFGQRDYARGPAVKVGDNVSELWHVTQCGSRNRNLQQRSSPLDTILTHIVQPTSSRPAKKLPITDINSTEISTAK